MENDPVPADTGLTWMNRALAEAARGRGRVEPNPMVGAVLVRDGSLVGVGHHGHFGGPHAEVVALADAGDRAQGATLYVTLEPCCHHGKTPPCTDAVLRAGVARVVAAMADPFPRVAGGGLAILREAGIDVAVGVGETEVRRLNAPYLKRILTGTAFVTAKWAMTLDGKMACANGDSRWISNEQSRARVHEFRGLVDAILVGIGTALRDDPELTARPAGPRVATRVVLDRSARLPLSGRLATTAREIPTLVVVGESAPAERVRALEDAGCEIFRPSGDGESAPAALLRELAARGMTNVLVEGGGQILGAFRDADQIDAVDVFIAPKLEGGQPIHAPLAGSGSIRMADAPRLEAITTEFLGGDLRVRGLVPRPWLRPGSGPPS